MTDAKRAQSERLTSPVRGLPLDRVAEFCRKWKVRELAIFGSALRGELLPESDVDFLVTFAAGSDWTLLDHFRMEEELGAIVGREVDLVNRIAVERSVNWLRRREILSSARTVYAA